MVCPRQIIAVYILSAAIQTNQHNKRKQEKISLLLHAHQYSSIQFQIQIKSQFKSQFKIQISNSNQKPISSQNIRAASNQTSTSHCITSHQIILLHILFEALICFVAKIMLYLAGILCSSIFIHSKVRKKS